MSKIMTKKNKIARYAAIFKEWSRRFEDDPESFGDVLDDDGNVVSGYAENCAHYFEEIENELFKSDPVVVMRPKGGDDRDTTAI